MANEATKKQIHAILTDMLEQANNPDEHKRVEIRRLRQKKAQTRAKQFGL